MERCRECGGEGEFRHVPGRSGPIFIHLFGACGARRPGVLERGRPATTESSCSKTRCRHCGEDVLFIRHNGGCVWIDPPPGYPWNKHRCMYPEEVRAGLSPALVSLPPNKERLLRTRLLLAIVTQAKYSEVTKSTTLQLTSVDDGSLWSAIVKNDCQRLFDYLVIVDQTAPNRTKHTVTRFDTLPFAGRLLRLTRLT